MQVNLKFMNRFTSIKIEDFNYPLPDERIAKYPLEQRDQSKLLFLHGKTIEEKRFSQLPTLLPAHSLLLFNETRVIQARLLFNKKTGAAIEIFCLEPVEPSTDFQIALQQKPPVVWKCLVGHAKKWKQGKLEARLKVGDKEVVLVAEKLKKLNDAYLIQFTWEPEETFFSDILESSGLTPLPPYLHREAEAADKKRYQTIYAKLNGSVAAPTAGLHFTQKLLDELPNKGFETEKIILHVGAGTFKPVSAEAIGDHQMHTEKIKISKESLEHLQDKLDQPIIPVGTTSMRSLESLFWMALRLYNHEGDFKIVGQWDPYSMNIPDDFTAKKAIQLLINHLEKENKDYLEGQTQLMIVPGYHFRFATGLITNFHQPKSTLLLLVSALIGNQWKDVYDFALLNNFRFLSYGDSCLFLPNPK